MSFASDSSLTMLTLITVQLRHKLRLAEKVKNFIPGTEVEPWLTGNLPDRAILHPLGSPTSIHQAAPQHQVFAGTLMGGSCEFDEVGPLATDGSRVSSEANGAQRKATTGQPLPTSNPRTIGRFAVTLYLIGETAVRSALLRPYILDQSRHRTTQESLTCSRKQSTTEGSRTESRIDQCYHTHYNVL